MPTYGIPSIGNPNGVWGYTPTSNATIIDPTTQLPYANTIVPGTLSSRPAATSFGIGLYLDETNTLHYSNGTRWAPIYGGAGISLCRAIQALVAAATSPGFIIDISDSTGDDGFGLGALNGAPIEHFAQRYSWMSSILTTMSHSTRLWSDTLQQYGDKYSISIGSNGRRYIGMPGTTGCYLTTPKTADMEILSDTTAIYRIDAPVTFPTGIDAALFNRESAYSDRITPAGLPQFFWTQGAAGKSVTGATSVLPYININNLYKREWVAATSTANWYYSTNNGTSWTLITTGTLSTAGSIDTSTQKLQFGGRGSGGTAGYWPGKFYEATLYAGIGAGRTIVACPDADMFQELQTTFYDCSSTPAVTPSGKLWTLSGAGGGGYTRGGSLGFLNLNASAPGKYLDYHSDATRYPLYTPFPGVLDNGTAAFKAAPQCLAVSVSHSHNGGTDSPAKYLVDLDALVTGKIIVTYPQVNIIIHAQNPQTEAANYPIYHITRSRASLQYAAAKGFISVDALAAFLNNSNWRTDYLTDSLHPNQAGQNVWAAVEQRVLSALASGVLV